jgi:hypothetical protein
MLFEDGIAVYIRKTAKRMFFFTNVAGDAKAKTGKFFSAMWISE